MRSLVRIVSPTEEPINAEEAMAFLRVDDADEAPLIESLISVARQMVEDFTGRSLVEQQWKLTASEWPDECHDGDEIALERTPLVSVESVKYYPASGASQATLSSDNYHVLTGPTPGLIVLSSDESWPDLYDRPDAVEVRFTAGASDVADIPPMCLHAVRLAVSHLYENRGAINIGNIVNELPMSLKYMLESQRVGGWVA